ncbi:hypothetical protein [Xanthomonas euvesicatoria]|jgi:hypothetical protein|uniref:hypothetical protein n=1 Tax=Xanthomonas euvesicatoria TaxID=456327 RepID=UPI000F8CA810|nr:hypothetical protein [Xanthomonas euvesicatoria]
MKTIHLEEPSLTDLAGIDADDTTEARRESVLLWIQQLAERGNIPGARIEAELARYIDGTYDIYALSRAVIAPHAH